LKHLGFSSPHFTLRALQGQQPFLLLLFGSGAPAFFGRGMPTSTSTCPDNGLSSEMRIQAQGTLEMGEEQWERHHPG